MWTHFLWVFSVIIFGWSCSSDGAYRLLDSRNERYESCPAVNLNAQHKTYYNVNKINTEEASDGKEACGISDKRPKPVHLLLRIINIKGWRREPTNVIKSRRRAEPVDELFKENPVFEKPKRKLILILNQKRERADPANHHYM